MAYRGIRTARAVLGLLAAAVLVADAAAQTRAVPYYASLSAGQARMRAGPGRNYPASWLYVRAGLPVRVVGVFREWRRIEDPEGTQGWMQANLLTERRTAIVTGGIAAMRDTQSSGGRILFRAAPGVVGRISRCDAGWCWFDVGGRAGYVEAGQLWGVEATETID